MTETLVWDEAGSRYYETGVSRGTFFPIDGSKGVPWNGLVSVGIDPQGGEHEAYYFDGTKYMERILAEDFQATIQAITTPKEFRACEGVREYKPGVMTEMNKRDKFHMTWRTEISSDEGESIGYKLHIAYNNLVQPSSRNYQTLADTATMDIRSYVITATPACGPHSYFWFDSREYNLNALEALINIGVLPKCHELAALVTPVDPDGTPFDPDAGCNYLIEDFESYFPGQTVTSDDKVVGDTEAFVNGVINNGLDTIVLPAEGAFAANDSAASEVGTSPTLTDDDDATYITSADGDLGYTVGLSPLVGYVAGCTFELHIRMSITGGVDPDDPDNLDADAQVHISTDDTGVTTIGGFSDGADEGMGFSLSAVDGTIVDYVVPLDLTAWHDTTIDDVVTALKAGAYLDVVAASNNNPDPTDTPIVVNVYEASVVMLNATDQDKWLRPNGLTGGSTELYVYDTGTTDISAQSNTVTVDFKVLTESFYTGGSVDYQIPVVNWGALGGAGPGVLMAEMNFDDVDLVWYADDWTTELSRVRIETAKWYRAEVDWYTDKVKVRAWDRGDTAGDPLMDYLGGTPPAPPQTAVTNTVGFMSSGGVMAEVVVDNAYLQCHCHYVSEGGTFSIDIPVSTILSRPFGGGPDTAWSSDDNYATMTDSYAIRPEDPSTPFVFKFGTGPNKFNWSLPSGATVDSVKYVVTAYAEATGADAGMGADAGPILILSGGVGGDRELDMGHHVHSWTWMIDQEWPFDEDWANLEADNPYDHLEMFNRSTTYPGDIITKITYLAIRITYTIP